MPNDLLMRARIMLPLVLLCVVAMPATGHAAEAIVGVTAGASPEMVRFDSNSPGTIVYRAPVSGLAAGEQVVGIDQRPAGEVIAFTSANRVMQLDPQNGAVTLLGVTAGTFGATVSAGVDFNPAADRLRLVNAANDNGRFNPVTNTYVQDDTDLAYIATDPNVGVDPNVVASGYDRNDLNGATATTLFGIDSTLNTLVRQGAVDGNAADVAGGGSPNGGLLTTLGSLNFDPTSNVAFDIATPSLGGADTAYLATQTQGGPNSSELRTINLPGTNPIGTTTSLGTIDATALSGMTILHGGALRIAGPNTLVSEAAAQAVVHIERVGNVLAPVQLTYETADRSALAGLDYEATSGFLNFAAGETSQDITIPLIGDSELEGAEVFDLNLDLTSPGAVLEPASQPVAIADDETAPTAPAGPSGPQGPAGPQGPPGRDAKVTCTVKKKGKKVRVTCKVTSTKAKTSSVRARLMRGKRTYARGSGGSSGVLRLRASRTLRPGRYVLETRITSADGQVTVVRDRVRL